MSGQMGLFDAPLRPLARHGDASPSIAAAEAVVRSGAFRNQLEAVLCALFAQGERTSAELARVAGLDRYAVARRLPDLLELGYAEKHGTRMCAVSETPATVWRVTALGERAHRLGLPIVRPEKTRRRPA